MGVGSLAWSRQTFGGYEWKSDGGEDSRRPESAFQQGHKPWKSASPTFTCGLGLLWEPGPSAAALLVASVGWDRMSVGWGQELLALP